MKYVGPIDAVCVVAAGCDLPEDWPTTLPAGAKSKSSIRHKRNLGLKRSLNYRE